MLGGALADRLFVFKPLDALVHRINISSNTGNTNSTVISQESDVVNVAETVSPSVVTVSIITPQRRVLQFDPFGGGFQSSIQGGDQQDIGSGFIAGDGIVITNKHVVSDTSASYKVVTQDSKEHEVTDIIRDPANDLAIIKFKDSSDYKPLELGDSDNLKVGQFVIAIGTALGEFRHTVTTGVVSGLGRGITAGSAYEGYVERLDNVIQTDAAINPGNSGGPLLDSQGKVIGVNVAVAQGAQNIGFALPISLVKDGLAQFNSTGSFASKPFLGVEHQMITREGAIFGEVPQGAYVSRVIADSAADKAGVKEGDIITKVNDDKLSDLKNGLTEAIAKYKVGDTIKLEIWRDGKTIDLNATLSNATN